MNDATQSDFRRVHIDALELYGQGEDMDFFIKLPSKFLKIKHKGEEPEPVLERYKSKGISEFYMTPEDFNIFAQRIKATLTLKMKEASEKEPDKPEVKGKILSDTHDVFKEMFSSGRIDEEGMDIAKEVSKESLVLISKTNMLKKFKEFRENCKAEYLHALMTTYISSLMIDQFDWGNDEIKKKVSLAAMLCDITLDTTEFDLLRSAQNQTEHLTDKIIKHPLNVSTALAKISSLIEPETLIIIEQHHERPNGKGFPQGLDHQKISVLTAVYIVAHYFIERMFDKTFKEEYFDDRLEGLLRQVNNTFYQGQFKKASEALIKVFEEGKWENPPS